MRLIISIFCLCISHTGYTQTDLPALMRNPDVTWVADFQHDYRFGTLLAEQFETNNWNATALRYYQADTTDADFGDGYETFVDYWLQLMLNLVENEELAAFQDALCTKPMQWEQREKTFSSKDTIGLIGLDKPTEIINWLTRNDIAGMRVQHRAILNTQTNLIELQALAWAPLSKVHNRQGSFMGLTPMCWFPIDEFSSGKTAKHVQWIVEARQRNIKEPANLDTRKGHLDMPTHARQLLNQPKLQFYDRDYPPKPCTVDQIWAAAFKSDTVVVLDPMTHEAGIKVLNHDVLSKIEGLRFAMQFGWDAERKRLLFKPVAYALMVKIEDESGNFQYFKPFFQVKVPE